MKSKNSPNGERTAEMGDSLGLLGDGDLEGDPRWSSSPWLHLKHERKRREVGPAL